jgi:hypothetical protein
MTDWWDGIVPATKPRDNEKLWEVWARHKLFSCELKYHGEFGVEAQSGDPVPQSRACPMRVSR